MLNFPRPTVESPGVEAELRIELHVPILDDAVIGVDASSARRLLLLQPRGTFAHCRSCPALAVAGDGIFEEEALLCGVFGCRHDGTASFQLGSMNGQPSCVVVHVRSREELSATHPRPVSGRGP